MKTVGIILRDWKMPYEGRIIDICGLGKELIDFFKSYENINVICIPVNNAKEIVDICDGIIFPGGIGITKKDKELMNYLYKIDKPTLGICLGMQIMGSSFDGKVEEDVVGDIHSKVEDYVHEVKIDKNSKLYQILGEENIKVNSRHKDRVKYTKLDCVATSEDNIIEAIEDKSKKFFIGVQWHPESLPEDKYTKKLFDYFISKL